MSLPASTLSLLSSAVSNWAGQGSQPVNQVAVMYLKKKTRSCFTGAGGGCITAVIIYVASVSVTTGDRTSREVVDTASLERQKPSREPALRLGW